MVNRKNWLVIPVMLLVLGMTIIGCDDDPGGDPDLNGTWIYSYYSDYSEYYSYTQELKMNKGSYEFSRISESYTGPTGKGTYTTSDGNIYFQSTHVHGGLNSSMGFESRWYTYDEYLEKIKQYYASNGFVYNETHSIITYSVSGNTLTLTYKYENGQTSTMVYTRK